MHCSESYYIFYHQPSVLLHDLFLLEAVLSKFFIMFYGVSLRSGNIKCSLYIYQPQIPVDHKDRSTMKTLFQKKKKVSLYLKRNFSYMRW